MRNPNGYGGISRLPGKRRRPYRVRVTVGWVDRGDSRRELQRYATIGYYETRGEAMMALAEYNRSPYDPVSRRMTFKEAYDAWSPEYFARFPSTRRVTESAIAFCRPLWYRPLADLRTGQLQEVIDGMEEFSRGYQSKVRSLMRMIYRWAMGREIVDRDWSEFVELTAQERESPRRVFTGPEIDYLWELYRSGRPVPGEPEQYRGRGMLESLLLLLYTGMRVGELLGLERDDVFISQRYIDLRGTKTRAARRQVPLHREIIPVVERLLELGGPVTVMTSGGGKPMTYSMYKYSWFDRVMPAMGFSHTPHDTRHTFVSAMDSAGVRRGAIKFIVGHSQADITDRYTHKDLPELIREVDKLCYDL